MINPGFNIEIDNINMDFIYGTDVFGPEPEKRYLDNIRHSLHDPYAQGPSVVYSIAMDVGKKNAYQDLKRRNLLYGAVQYPKGQIGQEPIKSQGHIHSISTSCGSSTPEVYEIWQGQAIIYMQESATDHPGRCFAVYAKKGEVVIVPPYWAHATINADPSNSMAFGAWCIRDYSFEYTEIRARHGLAFYPFIEDEKVIWQPNEYYVQQQLIEKSPRIYSEFGIEDRRAIYSQYEIDNDKFNFVTDPIKYNDIWENFVP